ncbi:MAG: TIGR01212 family radical SAM protein [Rectinemataceae bacterium]|nr:TIGR01212 family radical SAM protein [Rectinemataceae bacterium]
MDSRFNRHADRLIERHGEKVWRLGIDAGFTCPHREDGRGAGGCIFCSPEAGLATYQHEGRRLVTDLEEQISRAVGFTRSRYKARLFFLYFQAYSCTNLPPDRLKTIYDRAIAILAGIAPGSLRGLVVSTRPDCFDAEKAALLASYAASGLEVWLELGLQSSSDATLRLINRGHSAQAYADAADIAGKAGLRRAVHVMLGLPGEGRRQMLDTIGFVAACGGEGIKFHDLRLAHGAALTRSYPAGEYAPLHPSRLPGLLTDCLEILPPKVEVMRLSADFRQGEALDVFPPTEKTRLYTAVEAELRRRGTRQGSAFGHFPDIV